VREAIGWIVREEELEFVALSGSSARDAEKAGDLHLGVCAYGPIDRVGRTNRFHRALGRSDVDLADLRRADPLLLFFVDREGILLYEAKPGTFPRFHNLAARRYYDTAHFREGDGGGRRVADDEIVVDSVGEACPLSTPVRA